MNKWLKALLYAVVALFGLFVVLVGLVLAIFDPYSFEDMSRGGICERSGDVAPQCAMPPESAEKVLAALFACDAQFFKILDEEKPVFKRAHIVAHPYNLLDSSDPRISVVRSPSPTRLMDFTSPVTPNRPCRERATTPGGFMHLNSPTRSSARWKRPATTRLRQTHVQARSRYRRPTPLIFLEHGLVAVLPGPPVSRTCLRSTICSCLETSLRDTPISSISSSRR